MRDAAAVGVKLATTSVTPAEAQQQLATIQVSVDNLARKNPSLPIGVELMALSTAINAVLTAAPTDAASIQTSAMQLGTAATGVVDACAAAGQ